MKIYLLSNWKDIAAFASIFLLTSISVYEKYQLGMLTGFIIFFVFFSYERIKRIIIELNIKKIFGVEFGEIERAKLVEGINIELQASGTSLKESEIENIADIALNQIQGIAYKGRYYEEMVHYALKDLNYNPVHRFSGAVGELNFYVDFLVEIDGSRVIGIESIYSSQRYLRREKLRQIKESVSAISKAEDLAGFVIITNAEVREPDMKIITNSTPPITLIDETVSPGAVLSRLGEYFRVIKLKTKSNKAN